MASNSLPGLNFELTANVARFQSDMDKAGRITENTVGKIQGAFNKLQGSFAGLGGALLFGEVVRQAADAERAMAQLESGVRATGGAAGYSSKQLSAMADSLSKITDNDDDAIRGAESILLTFTKIGKEAFPQAIKSTLDLAAKFGTDLPTAAMQLGKALQDPIAGVNALKKAGVSFTEAQKATMKSMVESGNILGAQKMIYKELATEMGGAAEAVRNTLGGSFNAMQRSAEDVLKAVGLSSSDGLRGAFDGISGILDEVAEHADLVSKALQGVAAAAAVMTAARIPAVLGQISTALTAAVTKLGAVGIAGVALAATIGVLVAMRDETFAVEGHTITLSAVVQTLGKYMGDVWNAAVKDVMWFGKQIGIVSGLIQQIGKRVFDSFNVAIQGLLKQFKPLLALFEQAGKFLAKMMPVDIGKGVAEWVEDWKSGYKTILEDSEKLAKAQAKAKEHADVVGTGGGGGGAAEIGKEQQKHIDAVNKFVKEHEAKVAGLKEELAGHKEIGSILSARLELENKIGKLSDAELKRVEAILKREQELTHQKEFQKSISQLQQNNKFMETEITQGKIAAEIARQRATLEERIGTLTAREASELERAVVAGKALEAIKQLGDQHKQLSNQQSVIEAELAGRKEMIPLLQLQASLEQQGVFEALKHAQTDKDRKAILDGINKVVQDTLTLQREQAQLATKNMLDGLDAQIQKQRDVLNLGKEAADIEEQLRQARKTNPYITDGDIAALKEKVRLTQELTRLQAGADYLRGLQDQTKEMTEQTRQKLLLSQHLDEVAKYEAIIYEYEKRTKMVADESVKLAARRAASDHQYQADAQRAIDLIEQQKTATEKYKDQVGDLNRLYSKGLLTLQQYQTAVSNISPAFQRFKDVAQGVADSLSKGLDDWLLKGGKFTDVLKNIGKELLALVAKKAILEPLSNWISGGITGLGSKFFKPPSGPTTGLATGGGTPGPLALSPFNYGAPPMFPQGPPVIGMGMNSPLPGFAEGGRPPVNQWSYVGERGKELFMPDQPGSIIPSHMLDQLGFFQPDDDFQLAQFSLAPMMQQFAGMFGGMAGGGKPKGLGMGVANGGGSSFGPGWSTLRDENEKAAQKLMQSSQWKNSQGLGMGAQLDFDLANKMRSQNGGGMYSGFANPNTPVAPWAQHNYNGPPANLAESFGLNRQAAAMGAAANRAPQIELNPWGHDGNWAPGLQGGLLNSPLFSQYNNGVDLPQGSMQLGPYANRDINANSNRTEISAAHGGGWTVMPNPTAAQMQNPSSMYPGGHRYPSFPDGFGSMFGPGSGGSPLAYAPERAHAGAWTDPDGNLMPAWSSYSSRGPGVPANMPMPPVGSSTNGFAPQYVGYAEGGEFKANKPAWVGERGKELIMPTAPGKVISNHELQDMMGGGKSTINIHNNAKASAQVEESNGPNGKEFAVFIEDIVNRKMRDGALAKTMQRDYGLARKGTRH